MEEPHTAFKYELNQNYPNPFNPSTQIKYSIKEKGLVQLKVYDILGNEVATLVNEYLDSGFHSILYNVNSALPSGVYFYRLKAGDFIQTKKMILLK